MSGVPPIMLNVTDNVITNRSAKSKIRHIEGSGAQYLITTPDSKCTLLLLLSIIITFTIPLIDKH